MNPPAVILVNPKFAHNVGAAIRACACFDIETLLWSGYRIERDFGGRLPREERMKGYRSVDFGRKDKPLDVVVGTPVAIEVKKGSESLTTFQHPSDAVYVFGPEDGSLRNGILRLCHRFVHIPARHCLNLAASVNVVLADRLMKRQRLEGSTPPLEQMLNEGRGFGVFEEVITGWNGR